MGCGITAKEMDSVFTEGQVFRSDVFPRYSSITAVH